MAKIIAFESLTNYEYDCDKDDYTYVCKYRASDKDAWQYTSGMSKESAEADAEFLRMYGYTAKVCVQEIELRAAI